MATFTRSDVFVKNPMGPAVAGAQVYVCTQPANTVRPTNPDGTPVQNWSPTPLAAVYADSAGVTPLTQPLITDGFGHTFFYVAAGIYTIVVIYGGLVQQTYPDQSIGVASGGSGNVIQPGSFATSSGTVTLTGGNNITITTANGEIIVNGANPPVQSLSGGGTHVTGTAISLDIEAGNNISLASAAAAGALSLTINAISNALLNVSLLNGSSGALSVSAGAGIGIGQAGSTITISASTVAVGLSSLQVSSGNTAGATTNITSGGFTLVGGNNVTLSQSLGVITISAAATAAAATQSLSGGGTSITGTGVSLALVGGNNISLASASAANALTLTINASSNALNNVSLLNNSSGALSVSAGVGIGIGQAGSTITISASNQSALVSIDSLTAGGATAGTANTASSTAIVFAAGSNITLSQVSTKPEITIIGPLVGLSSLQISAGNTAGVTSNINSGGFTLVGGNNITLSQSLQVITISGAATSVVLSSLQISSGNTAGATSNITSGGFTLVGGNNITLSQSNQVITISGPTAGAPAATLSWIENGALSSFSVTSGTNANAGHFVNSVSLYLQRMFIPGVIKVTEADLALKYAVAATSASASMNRSFAVYSFVNSTLLGLVISATQGISFFGSGTTTGASTNWTQVVAAMTSTGGVIVPMTFASSSLAAGDYVIANQIDMTNLSSQTWTLYGLPSLFSTTQQQQVVTNIVSNSVSVLSAAGLLAASAHTASGSTSISEVTALSTANVISNAGTLAEILVHATVTTTASTTGSAASFTVFTVAPTNVVAVTNVGNLVVNLLSSNGLLAGSFFTATTGTGVLASAFTANSNTFTVSEVQTVMNSFNYLGAGSNTQALVAPFSCGVFSNPTSNNPPANITLASSNTSLTSTGALNAQPWILLIGQ